MRNTIRVINEELPSNRNQSTRSYLKTSCDKGPNIRREHLPRLYSLAHEDRY